MKAEEYLKTIPELKEKEKPLSFTKLEIIILMEGYAQSQLEENNETLRIAHSLWIKKEKRLQSQLEKERERTVALLKKIYDDYGDPKSQDMIKLKVGELEQHTESYLDE